MAAEPTFFDQIKKDINAKYDKKIATEIINKIEEEGFDDDSLWLDVKDEEQSTLKDLLTADQFSFIKKACQRQLEPPFNIDAISNLNREYKGWDDKLKETRKVYFAQCPLLIKADQDQTLMNTATLGRDNSIPLITYFVDTFNRYRISTFLNKKGTDILPVDFTKSLPYYKDLQKSEQTGTKVHSILNTYQTRFVRKLPLNPQTQFLDDVQDILRYIYGVSQMIEATLREREQNQSLSSDDEEDLIPFQFDLVIIPYGGKQSKASQYQQVDITDSDDESDSDDEEYSDDEEESYDDHNNKNKRSKDKIGSIEKRLKKYDIKSAVFKMEQKVLADNAAAVIKRRINENFKMVRKGRNGRFVMVVDRRSDDINDDDEKSDGMKKSSDDKIYIYSPKCDQKNNDKDKDKDEDEKKGNNYHQLHHDLVEESLVYKTTKCLLPGLTEANDPHLGCKSGDFITLSFHVLAVDVIKCYLYINGGGSRFEPSDLIDLLPNYFVKRKSDSNLLNKDELNALFPLKLKDEKFEAWYKQTTSKKLKNHGRK